MRRLRSASLVAALVFIAAPVGTAAASDDDGHPFAGNWTTTYDDLSHGAIDFRLVSDQEGAAALTALGGSPCAEPADYYRGTYTTENNSDVGTHVGCSRLEPGATVSQLVSRYQSPLFQAQGSFEIRVSQSNPEFWNGSFLEDGVEGDSGTWIGTFAGHFTGDGAGTCPGVSPVVRAPLAVGVVTVSSVRPDVEYRRAGTQGFCPLVQGSVLGAGDELISGPAGQAVLQFDVTATVTVEESTKLKIGSFLLDGGIVKIVLLLAAGSVVSNVNPPSDFSVVTPTAVASAQGTAYKTAYQQSTQITLTSVTEGIVSVQAVTLHDPYTEPQVPRGGSVTLNANQEVQISALAVGTIAAIGQSTPPSTTPPLTKAKAIGKVRAILRQNADECDLRTRSVTARAITGGWRVTARVRLDGGRARNAVWTVKGQATPKTANALARRIQRGCP